MKKSSYIFVGFLIGAVFAYLLVSTFKKTGASEDSHIIAYELKRMNKMVVAEQLYADVYTHKSSKYIPGLQDFFSFDKKVVLLVNAKIQATYDLSKMNVQLDSVQKIIYIESIPPLDVQIYPEVKFYDLEQSTFNSFKKDELNEIQARAIEHIEKTVDREKLETQAHEQLIQNLSEIYLLAKAYNWKIVDKTSYAKEVENFLD